MAGLLDGNGAASQASRPSILPGTTITSQWELVTPQKAQEYLSHNIPHNRRLMRVVVDRYACDMKAGHWATTHEGIGFDDEGRLIDSQHRLTAIVQSGVSVWMLVTRGLPKEAVQTINRGKQRTLAHALQILGYDHSDHKTIALTRQMMSGPNTDTAVRVMTDLQVRDFIDNHLQAISFARVECGRAKAPSIVGGLIARAYYRHDPEHLRRFLAAYADMVPAGQEQPRDKMVRRLSQLASGFSARMACHRRELYCKAQNVLRAWVENAPMDKIYECAEDLYPLPTDATI